MERHWYMYFACNSYRRECRDFVKPRLQHDLDLFLGDSELLVTEIGLERFMWLLLDLIIQLILYWKKALAHFFRLRVVEGNEVLDGQLSRF